MAEPKKPIKAQMDIATVEISPPVLAAVGLVIVQWANIESAVQVALQVAAGVDSQVGRLVIVEPRLTDKFSLLADLLTLAGIKFSSDKLSDLRSRADALSKERNRLAHGVWFKHGLLNVYKVLDTTGTHAKGTAIVRSKRALPTVKYYSIPELNRINLAIHALKTDFDAFAGALPLERKPPQDFELQPR